MNVSTWDTLYLKNFLDVVAATDPSRPVWPVCPAYPWAAGVDPDSSLPNGAPLAISNPATPSSPWEAHFYRFDLCVPMRTPRDAARARAVRASNRSFCRLGSPRSRPLSARRASHVPPVPPRSLSPAPRARLIDRFSLPAARDSDRPALAPCSCKTPETCSPCVDDSFYPDTSYASEFGWVGAPSFETLAPFLTPDDFTLTSPVMAYHGNTFIRMDAVRNMVLYNFGRFAAPFVDTPSVAAFRAALHLSAISQADCIRAEVEHYRRGRNGPANTHGALYWMLDAIWPSTSWDSLEYGGRWKALHYAARDFYDPIALDAYCDPGILDCSSLVVHVGSERMQPVSLNVTLDVVRFADGGVTTVASWPAALAPGSGAFFQVPSTTAAAARGGCGALTDCLMLVRALDSATGAPLRAPAIRSLTLWANASLPAATVTLTQLPGGAVSVATDAVAPHTMLHAAELGRFSNNNLLLLPGQPQSTQWLPTGGGAQQPTGVYAVAINGGS